MIDDSCESLAPLDAEAAAWIGRHLRKQLPDPQSELATITGKTLKHEYKRLLRHMESGDHLCDWAWHGKSGARDAYSIGWCLVREGKVLYSICHSSG